MPQDRLEAPAPSPGNTPAITVGRADGDKITEPPPPHLLWEALEIAYAKPEDSAAAPSEEPLGLYAALPMALGLSLVLWVIIVELVLMR